VLTITPILPAMCRSNLRPKPNPLLEFPDNREGSDTIEPKGRRGAAGLWRREEEGAAAARGRQRAPPGAGPHTPAALRRHGRRPGGVPRPAGARRREHHADAGRLRARRSGAAPCRGDGQGEWRLATASSRSGSSPPVVEWRNLRPVLSCPRVQPSVTTDEIDRAVHQMIVDAGAYPSPLGYGGFPKSVCTSVNECTCHGIPDSRELQVQPPFSSFFSVRTQKHFLSSHRGKISCA
jgi:hypothetical protein